MTNDIKTVGAAFGGTVDWKNCIEKISAAASVSLFPHVHADGDALGSVFALAIALRKHGKRVRVLLCEAPEAALRFLVPDDKYGIEVVIHTESTDIDKIEPSELAVGVDCASPDRMEKWYTLYEKSPVKIKIDHHIENEKNCFGNVKVVNDSWAATGEGIWLLLAEMGISVDYDIAIRLYTAILTDTGRFIYSNVTPLTFSIAAELIKITGSDLSWIARQVYDVKPQRTIRFLSAAYSRIEYFADGKIAYVYVPDDVFKSTEALTEDSNALSSIMRDIEGVEVSIFVRDSKTVEKTNAHKASMRSTEKCDVAKVAALFGGGGHIRAAGFTYVGSEAELKEIVLKEVGAQLGN